MTKKQQYQTFLILLQSISSKYTVNKTYKIRETFPRRKTFSSNMLPLQPSLLVNAPECCKEYSACHDSPSSQRFHPLWSHPFSVATHACEHARSFYRENKCLCLTQKKHKIKLKLQQLIGPLLFRLECRSWWQCSRGVSPELCRCDGRRETNQMPLLWSCRLHEASTFWVWSQYLLEWTYKSIRYKPQRNRIQNYIRPGTIGFRLTKAMQNSVSRNTTLLCSLISSPKM